VLARVDAAFDTEASAMGRLLLFGLLTWITGNPILALVAVLLVSAVGYGYAFGRLFQIPRTVNRWLAIRDLDRTVRTNPHDATAQADLGRLLVEAGQPGRAEGHLEVAYARAAEVPEIGYYLGAARLRLGDEARGRPLIEQALAQDPRLAYGEPHLRLADYYLEHGRPAEAVTHLERFREIHTSSVEGRYKLARAYLATGQPDRARAELDEALQAYRGAPRFKRREARLWRLRAGWLRWTLRS
jgi:tetratricopeptide (TPR) repeat protein